MAKNNNKNGKAQQMAQVIAGTRKHFQNGSQSLVLEGASTTFDAVVKTLQGFIDDRAAIVAVQTDAKNKVAAEKAALPAITALLAAYIAFLRNQLGSNATALADFGISTPKKAVPKTTEEQAIIAAKRKATRQARGTKSAKAKKSIHGNVTAKLVVTPAADPAPAAPVAPAPKA